MFSFSLFHFLLNKREFKIEFIYSSWWCLPLMLNSFFEFSFFPCLLTVGRIDFSVLDVCLFRILRLRQNLNMEVNQLAMDFFFFCQSVVSITDIDFICSNYTIISKSSSQ